MTDSRLTISIHILTLLAGIPNEWISSDFIAGSININPVLVRKEVANLKKAGFIESKEGKGGGSRLAKKPSEISFDLIYGALYDCCSFKTYNNQPNPQCPIGNKIEEKLINVYIGAEQAFIEELKKTNIENFLKEFK
jgi:DNA-binding IscR family transcriptional regulator